MTLPSCITNPSMTWVRTWGFTMALGGPLLTGGCVVPLTVGCGALSGTKLLKDIKTYKFQNNITIYIKHSKTWR